MKSEDYFIDLSLNPKNAAEKGYEYVDDIVYNPNSPERAMKDIMELINLDGYKLGRPSPQNEQDNYYGLYRPKEDKNTK